MFLELIRALFSVVVDQTSTCKKLESVYSGASSQLRLSPWKIDSRADQNGLAHFSARDIYSLRKTEVSCVWCLGKKSDRNLSKFLRYNLVLVARGVGFNGSFFVSPCEEFYATCSTLQAVHVTQ